MYFILIIKNIYRSRTRRPIPQILPTTSSSSASSKSYDSIVMVMDANSRTTCKELVPDREDNMMHAAHTVHIMLRCGAVCKSRTTYPTTSTTTCMCFVTYTINIYMYGTYIQLKNSHSLVCVDHSPSVCICRACLHKIILFFSSMILYRTGRYTKHR